MAGKLNLKINKGETFRYTLKWLDATETPVDLTSYEARMQVRPDIDSDQILLTFASDPLLNPDGTITLNPTTGEIVLWLGATTTAALTWTAGVYDLEMYQSADEVTRLVEGKISVTKEVTR